VSRRKRAPMLLCSELTGQVYIVTRWSERAGRDEEHAIIVAHEKYDVTDEFEQIVENRPVRKAKRRRGAAQGEGSR